METEIVTAYVSIGSNLGDRAGNLLLAVRGLMEASFCVNKLSAVYETEPHGVENQPPFLNMVAEINLTSISASQMMARMLRIEYLLGRREKMEKKPRTVDLDLLLFGSYTCETDFLTLPHPRMPERRFVLTPLTEIAPHLIHPQTQKTMTEMLALSDDFSIVKRWNPNPKTESINSKVILKSKVQDA
ncbi:MAG TPA: 2-amino-4-hydroxy-6-hydroxymethyldihydropteridine diphosphokinase [Pyrinomonadaceae bacterium]|nr:2-amino-4-hydroxy-6-hydroxymethyldihydropteridine diphosphokinase [Pyrinomonadaceae bacterium]